LEAKRGTLLRGGDFTDCERLLLGACKGQELSCCNKAPKTARDLEPTVWLAVIVFSLLVSVFTFADNAPATYKTRCAPCHGAKGAGDTMIGKNMGLRPLGASEVQNQSDDELFAIISKGKKNRMPAFDNKLSKDQIRDLVRYIRSLKQ
jgi:mono/diheme cytochrome c family protein